MIPGLPFKNWHITIALSGTGHFPHGVRPNHQGEDRGVYEFFLRHFACPTGMRR